MNEDESMQAAARELEMALKGNDFSSNKQLLAERVNELIQHDFQKLLSILYRIDVSEDKLKTLLKERPDQDAGITISELIIEREMQKIKSRQQFNQGSGNIDDDEKW